VVERASSISQRLSVAHANEKSDELAALQFGAFAGRRFGAIVLLWETSRPAR
jgi:hypothetical protein